jgi:hypothetical protein
MNAGLEGSKSAPPQATHGDFEFWPLQAFLAVTQEGSQVRMVLSELENHIGTLLKEHRGGVVAALVAATGRLGECQKEACKVRARNTRHLPTPSDRRAVAFRCGRNLFRGTASSTCDTRLLT